MLLKMPQGVSRGPPMLDKAELEPIMAAAIRSSLDCVIVIDEAGRVLEFNPAAEKTFGHRRAEALGRPIAELIVPGHLRDAHERGLARYVAGGEPHYVGRRVETEALHSDGRTFPVELTITEVRTASRRVFTASLRDLSQQASRAELEEVRRRLELAVEGAKLGIWAFDPKTGGCWYSDRSKELLGLPGNFQPDARALEAHIHPDDWPALSAPYYSRYPDRPLAMEFRALHGDGEVKWISALGAAVRDPDGNTVAIHGIHIDVTEQKRAAEELGDARRQLELAVNGAKIGSWTVDPETGATWYSERSRAMHGLPPDTPLDVKTLRPYIHPDDWDLVLDSYRRGFPGDLIELEHRVVRPGGEVRWLQSIGTALRDGSGRVRTVSGIHIDVTERKQAEAELARSREALHQSEKLAALGALLAGVSHELNNPLAAIVGQAEMLSEDCRGTPLETRAAKIGGAAERCARIVQTFLAMARQKEARRDLVDINALVSAALEIAEYGLRTAGVSVRANLASRLPPVEADRDQLHQVLVNLIVNAQQAMEACPEFEKTLNLRTSADGRGRVLVDISDTGPGVPEEMRRRIFDPFFTTKPQGSGTGIGLSFSLGIIEAHGGALTLEPSARGAHFRIALPAAAPAELVAEPVGGQASAAGPGGRALLVEDEPDVADTLRELLEREGFAVTMAANGAEALMAIDQTEFDLILSDLRMPGVSGPELFARLAETRPSLIGRIGFLTGDTLGSAMGDFVRSCGRPVLEKPFTRTGVRCLIEAVRAAPAAAEPRLEQ